MVDTAAFRLEENYSWIDQLGRAITSAWTVSAFGCDPVAAVFADLGALSVGRQSLEKRNSTKVESAMIGVFVSLDLLLFIAPLKRRRCQCSFSSGLGRRAAHLRGGKFFIYHVSSLC